MLSSFVGDAEEFDGKVSSSSTLLKLDNDFATIGDPGFGIKELVRLVASDDDGVGKPSRKADENRAVGW